MIIDSDQQLADSARRGLMTSEFHTYRGSDGNSNYNSNFNSNQKLGSYRGEEAKLSPNQRNNQNHRTLEEGKIQSRQMNSRHRSGNISPA